MSKNNSSPVFDANQERITANRPLSASPQSAKLKYWPDGEYYEGSYLNDERSGIGTYTWPNGDKFIGEWARDMRNGEGIFYNKKGEVIAKGSWKNDELVSVSK